MITVNPCFSVTERDRRWKVVREIMARPRWNLDAIIAPEVSDRSYASCLTQNGGADVVFPRDSAKPVHAFPGPGGYVPGPVDLRTAIWKRKLAGSWCVDGKLVIQEGAGSKSVIDGLKTLELNNQTDGPAQAERKQRRRDRNRTVQSGEHVRITETGYIRLGKRE